MSSFKPPDVVAEFSRRADLLKEIEKDPGPILLHYKENPVDFINDWGITYDPRLQPPQTPIIPFSLFPRQIEYIEWLFERFRKREDGVTKKSRDMGVTWLCCAFAWWLWIFHKGQVVSFGSRVEDLVDKRGDPKCIFEKVRMLIEYTPQIFMPKDYNKSHDSHMKITNPENMSVIAGEGGDNMGRGGRSSLYFKDESAHYDRPDRVEAALSMNSDVKIDVSTPNGVGNPFYRKCHQNVLPMFTFHWKDDPRKDQAWYDRKVRELDPVIVAQEIDMSFDASVDNTFITKKHVDRAMATNITDFDDFHKPCVLGVDPAGFGNDRTAFCLRQGRFVHWIETYQGVDTMQIVGLIGAVLRECPYAVKAVCIDSIGIGAGVFDRLYELHPQIAHRITVSESSAYEACSDIRSEIWYMMREWLKEECHLPYRESLIIDLCSLQYAFNSNSEYVLESKKSAKKRGVKSPDEGDALALTFAVADHILDIEDDDDYYTPPTGRNKRTGY